MNAQKETSPVTIKKYANRRLYDTETSAYITLEDLCERVKQGKEFVVLDAKSGQDLTRQVLTQIIFEQETKGYQLLPTNFLRDVIRFYDNKMNRLLQPYLEASMKTFISNQDRISGLMGKAMEDFSPLGQFEEMTRQNVALFEKTMSMFNPFGNMFEERGEEESEVEQRRKQRTKR